ncbi:hypothetical protein [Ralstonia solanacearum]|uniref:hypothetical protein n=1 Tax=Ralstonia solanacearum TaxID=305 RepID=UPI003AF32F25
MGGYFLEANNFIPADSLKTPSHIAPVWYFSRSIRCCARRRRLSCRSCGGSWRSSGPAVRALQEHEGQGVAVAVAVILALGFAFIDAKFWGVVVMGGSVVIFFFLPWLDQSPVKSIRYRPGFHKVLLGIFVVAFAVLGYLGIQPPSPAGSIVSQIGTIVYFAFFLAMPIWSRMGTFKPVPERVTFKPH